VEHVKLQLRSVAITSSQEPGKIFLGLDMTRAGYVSKENLREACIKHNLPCADDIIDCVRTRSRFSFVIKKRKDKFIEKFMASQSFGLLCHSVTDILLSKSLCLLIFLTSFFLLCIIPLYGE